MGLVAGPIGAVIAYLACYMAHGASNPMHTTLLHREVDGPHRTTVLSMNSMIAQPAGALGAITLARARRRDLDLDRDDRRRHHLRPRGTALHPGLAGRAGAAGGVPAAAATAAAATPARATERRAGTLP